MVMAGRLLIGIGVAMVYIPTMKILARWYRKNEFASLSGILLAVGNIGALSAAGPLAWLTGTLGWQPVFIMLGAITLLLAAVAWIIVRDRPIDMDLPAIEDIEAHACRRGGGWNSYGPGAADDIRGGQKILASGSMVFLHLWQHHGIPGALGGAFLSGHSGMGQIRLRHGADFHRPGDDIGLPHRRLHLG